VTVLVGMDRGGLGGICCCGYGHRPMRHGGSGRPLDESYTCSGDPRPGRAVIGGAVAVSHHGRGPSNSCWNSWTITYDSAGGGLGRASAEGEGAGDGGGGTTAEQQPFSVDDTPLRPPHPMTPSRMWMAPGRLHSPCTPWPGLARRIRPQEERASAPSRISTGSASATAPIAVVAILMPPRHRVEQPAVLAFPGQVPMDNRHHLVVVDRRVTLADGRLPSR